MRPDSTVLYSLVSLAQERGGLGGGLGRRGVVLGEKESACVFLAHPFGHFPSQTSARECKGSQGLRRAKRCLNDVITIHLFPLHLFHLCICPLMLLIPKHFHYSFSFSGRINHYVECMTLCFVCTVAKVALLFFF